MKYKILYALNRARIAGTERHVLYLLKHLNRDLFDPAVVCFSDGPLIGKLRNEGVATFALPRKCFPDIGHLMRLRQVIRRHQFDLIHSHSGQLACFAGRLAGVARTIETRHGLCLDYDRLDQHAGKDALLSRLKAAQVSKTLLVNEYDYNVMCNTYRIPAQKLAWLANGIDTSGLQPASSEIESLRQEFGLSPRTKLVGTVARCEPQKGLKYLVRAIAALKPDPNSVRFLLVGDGALQHELRGLASRLNVSASIIFTGYRSDALALMSMFDIFVLPSLWEGLPYTILEAMALKKPVITTNVFGNREVVIDGKTGYLIAPRDPGAIARAIGSLLNSPGEAEKMGIAGFERVRTQYSAEHMTREIEKIYLELLTG